MPSNAEGLLITFALIIFALGIGLSVPLDNGSQHAAAAGDAANPQSVVSGPLVDTTTGPAPNPELNNFNLTVKQATDQNGDAVSSAGTTVYNITVRGDLPRGNLPRLYPVEVVFERENRTLGKQTLFLSPTDSKQFEPDSNNQDVDYRLVERFQTKLFFNQETTQSQKTTITAESRLTDDEDESVKRNVIKGSSPPGRQSSVRSVITTNTSGSGAGVTFVSRYRIHSQSDKQGYLEDLGVPTKGEPSGNIVRFVNMRDSNGEAASINGTSAGFNLATRTSSIKSSSTMTLTIAYDLKAGENISVTPITATGRDINQNRDYALPKDTADDERCHPGDAYNLCVFTLSTTERQEIQDISELYLAYEGNERTQGDIFCQSVISGYLQESSETCGQGVLTSFSNFYTPETNIEGLESLRNVQLSRGAQFTINSKVGNSRTDDINNGQSVDVYLYPDESFNASGELQLERDSNGDKVISTEPILEQTVSFTQEKVKTLSKTGVEAPRVQDTVTYYTIVCAEGRDQRTCDRVNNTDTSSVQISTKSGPLGIGPEIVSEPYISYLTAVDGIKYKRGTNVRQLDERPGPDWDKESVVAQSFTGEQRWVVSVDGVTRPDDGSTLESAYEQQARSKLIDSSDWTVENVESTPTEKRVDYGGASLHENEDGWTRTQRAEDTIQDGTVEERFRIINTNQFSNLVRTEQGWYVNRSAQDLLDRAAKSDINVRYQHTNPNDCLDCLRAETVEERNNRVPSSERRSATENIWEKAEVGTIKTTALIETGEKLELSYGDPGGKWTLLFNNTDETSDGIKPDLYRSSVNNPRKIYKWTTENGANSVKFKRPTTSKVYEWNYRRYDMEYTFTEDVTDKEISKWTKPDYGVDYEYEESTTVWFDISNSYNQPRSQDSAFSHYEIQFTDASSPFRIDWNKNYQGKRIGNRNCPQDTYNVTPDSLNGRSGQVVIEYCQSQTGDDIVKRIGKNYSETGSYEPEVTLTDTSGVESSEALSVSIRKEQPEDPEESDGYPIDENIKATSNPVIDSIETVNEKVDYKSGIVVFKVNLTSASQKLTGDWQLTVSPSDRVSSASSCPAQYDSRTTEQLDRETESSEISRQTLSCISEEFENPDEIQQSFELVEVTFDDSGQRQIDYKTIPAGAIQSCSGSLRNVDERTCEVPQDVGQAGTTEFQYQDTNGDYKDVDAQLLQQCPAGYEDSTVSADTNQQVNDFSVECELEGSSGFNLKSREKRLVFTEIQQGAIQECSSVPGYSEETNGDNQLTKCQQDNQDNFGPDSFTLSETDSDGNTVFKKIPPGVIRECEDQNREQQAGTLSCSNDGNRYTYSTIQYGDWVRGSSTVGLDSETAAKSVWRDDVIPNLEETITVSVDPRKNDEIQPTGSETRPFEFELQKIPESGAAETTAVVKKNVQLCRAKSVSSLAKDDQGTNECVGFDSDFDGIDDYDRYGDDELTESEKSSADYPPYVMNSPDISSEFNGNRLNDACPYTQRYPRAPTTIEGNESVSDLSNLYNSNGNDPCEDSQSGVDTLSLPKPQETDTYTFGSGAWNDAESINNLRHTGKETLEDVYGSDNVAQAGYGRGEDLTIGYPIDNRTAAPEGLIAYYPFDHRVPDAGTDSHAYALMDVYGVNGENDVSSLYNGRIWYHAPCVGQTTGVLLKRSCSADFITDNAKQGGYHAYVTGGNSVSNLPRVGYVPNRAPFADQYAEGQGIQYEIANDKTERNGVFQVTYLPFPARDSKFKDDGKLENNVPYGERPPDDGPVPLEVSDLDDRYSNDAVSGKSLNLSKDSYALFSDGINACFRTGRLGNNDDKCNEDKHGRLSAVSSVDPSTTDDNPTTLEDKLSDAGGEYTISFWYKPDRESTGGNPVKEADPTYGFASHAVLGITKPKQDISEKPPNGAMSLELHTVISDPDFVEDPPDPDNPDGVRYCKRDSVNYKGGLDDRRNIGDPTKPSNVLADKSTRGVLSLSWPSDVSTINADTDAEQSTGGCNFPAFEQRLFEEFPNEDYKKGFNVEGEKSVKDDWNHVAVTREVSPRFEPTSTVYINGERMGSYIGPEGAIKEDSTITFGGKLVPIKRGLFSEIDKYEARVSAIEDGKIDELRVYDESLTGEEVRGETLGKSGTENVRPFDSNPKEGSITTSPQPIDDSGASISPSASLKADVKWEGTGSVQATVIPCESSSSSSCYNDANFTLSEFNFGPTSFLSEEDVSFDFSAINNRFNVEYVKLDVEIDGYRGSTPTVNEIQIEASESSFESCKEAIDEYNGVRNNNSFVEIQNADMRSEEPLFCDFDKLEGGWTRFWWLQQDAEKNTNTDQQPLFNRNTLEDCEPKVPMCLGSMPKDNEDTSIYIRAVNEDNETARWAVYSLNELMNYRSGSDEFGRNFNDPGCSTGNEDACRNAMVGTFSSVLDGASNVNPNAPGDDQPLYPIATSGNYEVPDNLDEVRYTHNQQRSRLQLIGDQSHINIRIQQTPSGVEASQIKCLGSSAYRCEFYYRQGDIPDYNTPFNGNPVIGETVERDS